MASVSARTTTLVLDSRHRDFQRFPSAAKFSLKVDPIRAVHAIQLVQSELQSDSLPFTTPVYVAVNDWSLVLLGSEPHPNLLARVSLGTQTWAHVNSPFDPHTVHFPVPQSVSRFDISLRLADPNAQFDVTQFALTVSLWHGV